MGIGPAVMGAAWSESPHAGAQGAGAGPGQHTWSGAGSIAAEAERAGGFVNRSTPPLSPVTDAMLANPPPADWLNWRRTPDGQGYSPLDEVNRGNVHRLRLAWALTMHEGSNQVTPLVHEGVMFLISPGNVIQALDAASRDLLWQYTRRHTRASVYPKWRRAISLYGERVYSLTIDGHVIALAIVDEADGGCLAQT